jgi:hypothetical protein
MNDRAFYRSLIKEADIFLNRRIALVARLFAIWGLELALHEYGGVVY